MKQCRYTEFESYFCDSCKKENQLPRLNFDNSGSPYFKCTHCEHCEFLSKIKNIQASQINKEFKRLSKHSDITLEDNYIPLAKIGDVVSGKGVVEENYHKWVSKVRGESRNPFSGRVLSSAEVPVKDDDITHIHIVSLLKQLEEYYGLKDHRNIDTKSSQHFHIERKKYIKNKYPNIDYFEFSNKNINDYTEEEKEAHLSVSDFDKILVGNKNTHIVENDFWLKLVYFNKDIYNGYQGKFLHFFDLSKWSPQFWAYILLMDTLTKDHPARDGDNINLYFFW